MQRLFLAAELKTIGNSVRHLAEQCLASLHVDGLTAIQCMMIGYLGENSSRDVFQRELEAEFQIRRSTVTGILQGMERRGLIIRQPVQHDARLKKVVLTPIGIEIWEKVWQSLWEIEERALKGVSEEDLLIFLRTLEKIKQNLM